MAGSSKSASETEGRHIAWLLSRVERDAHVSQRELAKELGVALGLANAYVKRCVNKGLIKVKHVPSRRYAYFLTPTGFAEKSKLVAEYLYLSLSFFRRAREECTAVLFEAQRRNWASVAIYGGGDLAEIAILCASEVGLKIVAVVDAGARKSTIFGVTVVDGLDAVRVDGWIVAGILDAQTLYDALVAHAGEARVLVPSILSVREGTFACKADI